MDEELFNRFKNGDKSAYEKIYYKYKPELIKYAKSIIKNDDIAEEIVQELFIKVYENPEKYNDLYSVKSYFSMMCYRMSVTEYNKTKRRATIEETFLNEDKNYNESDLSDEIEKNEDIEDLRKAMKYLKNEYRQVLELTEIKKLSIKETAKILGKTTDATKVLKHRAKKNLKKIINNEFPDLAKKYQKSLLQIIIIVLCLATISAGAVYATIKIIESVMSNPTFFSLSDYDKVVEMKEEYIPKEIAIEKMKYYLSVLGYEENSIDIGLYDDIAFNEIYWRCYKSDFELRIDAKTGKFSKYVCYTDAIPTNKRDENVEMILEKLGINLADKKQGTVEDEIDYSDNIMNYLICIFENNYQKIVVIYYKDYNYIINIQVINKNITNSDIIITEKKAISIVNDNFDLDIIDTELKYTRVDNHDNNHFEKNEKYSFSYEYRKAWKIITKDEYNRIKNIYVDCMTGEFIRIDSEI